MPEPNLTPEPGPAGAPTPDSRQPRRRARQLDKRDCWVRQAQETPSLREILSCDERPGDEPPG